MADPRVSAAWLGDIKRSLVLLGFACSAWLIAPGLAQGKTVVFTYTGAQRTFTVPAGVSSIHVVAIGAEGGGSAGTAGGFGAKATASLRVTPGEVLYIEVGGNGGNGSIGNCAAGAAGWNGGGVGGGATSGCNAGSGGGGGASDVRKVSRSHLGSLGSRVIVAGAGGGAAPEDSGGAAGNPGDGLYPGQPGTQNMGGSGGTNGTTQAGSGTLGTGGAGATDSSGSDGGGGGGGGLYGGGGGLNGAGLSVAASGGGGGSSGFGSGTTNTSVTPDTTGIQSITFTYTPPPNTTITGEFINSGKHKATFDFKGSGGVAPLHFQCKLDSSGWQSCTSPKTYTGLAHGSHTFQVRAIDSRGKADPTPAKKTFTI